MNKNIHAIYNRRPVKKSVSEVNKNPNRVSGGLRAQGVDAFTMLDEAGQTQHIPSQRYIKSLEEQVRTQKTLIEQLRKKSTRHDTEITQIKSTINKQR